MEYLNLLTEYRMMISVQNEIAVFLEGLYELIPEDLLAMFDEKELEVRFNHVWQYCSIIVYQIKFFAIVK